MSDGKLLTQILQEPPATSDPMLIRGTLLRPMIEQINRNTIALAPPRQVKPLVTQAAKDGELVEDSNEAAAATADNSATTGSDPVWQEITKTYEEVEVDGVTIRRRTSSQFLNSLTGGKAWWVFDNSDL